MHSLAGYQRCFTFVAICDACNIFLPRFYFCCISHVRKSVSLYKRNLAIMLEILLFKDYRGIYRSCILSEK